jgi:cephalosporin hydroxylase
MRKDFGYKCIIARDVYIHHFGSRTLKPYLGDDKEKYNQFFKNKHEILVDKWGEETVTKWLFTDLRLSDSPSQWPQGIKLGWAMPLTWPYINSGTHLSLMAMERPDFIYLEATRGGDIASKREAQIKKGMEMGCTHFFILDADMIYPPKILVDLFKLLENGADLAGGLCWRGYPPWEPVVWSKKDNYTLLPFRDFKLGEPIIDAGATGAACLLVKRRVFEALKKPWFQYKREEIIREDGTTEIDIQGEDNYFTRNATDAGFRLDIFTNYDVSHLREFEVDRNFWLMMAVMNKVIGPNNQWANVIALLKKLHEPDWFEREVNQASIDISWPIIQRHYEIGLLHNFLIGKKPKTVCEIGTKDGGTARLWESLVRPRNGMVFCIDKEFPISYLKGRTVRIKGNSHDPLTLSRLRSLNNGNKIDFLFIDGDHSFQGVKMDFEDYSPLVHPGGWIAFHDILDTEFQRSQGCEVSRFWEEIKDQYNHFEIIDPNNKNDMGIGILEWRI